MNGAGDPEPFHDIAEAGEFTAAVVPSKLLRVGYKVLAFATYYLFYLWLLEGFHSQRNARGALFVSLAVVTLAWTVGIGLTARGREGRRNRVEGYAVSGAGVVILWAPLFVKWLAGVHVGFRWSLPVGLVLVAGGVVLLLDGSRAYRREMKERFDVSYLYRKSWLGTPLRAVAVVWLAAGCADGAVFLVKQTADLFFDAVTFGALVLGVVGAVVMVAMPRRKVVYVDRHGRVVESLPPGIASSDR